MIVIDGKAVAQDFRNTLKSKTETLKSSNIHPGLAVILVGEDPASQVYVRNKIKACESTGIQSFEHVLPETISKNDLLALIRTLNNNQDVHGILLQLPLPAHLDANEMILAIDPRKDVDGLHPENMGRLVAGLEGHVPCTPLGSLHLIKTVEDKLSGKNAVILGRSLLFGKPMAQLLLAENCTVTTCHSRTKDLAAHCRNADILIAAIGQPDFVQSEWIKDGAIVIDVGVNRIPHPDDPSKTKLTGDIDYASCAPKTKAITPVPGGVGPMTIAYLLSNTIKAAEKMINL